MNHLSLYRPWLIRFTIYNLILLCLQFAYIFFKSSTFIHAIPLPVFIHKEIIYTLFIHVGLNLLLSVFQTTLLWGIAQRHFKPSLKSWQFVIFGLSVIALFTSNGYFFPLSAFSRLFLPELPHIVLMAALVGSLLPLCVLVLNTIVLVSQKYPRTMAMLAALPICLSIYTYNNSTVVNQSSAQPNIILIGVDSLPPSAINKQNTPAMAHFLEQSMQFKETISPLARTYPAWSTILTGLYPFHHGARYNLMPMDDVKSDKSIAWTLQKAGYQTIFATDDRRFNNIGAEFGFQQIIGPRMGVNDILIGTFNDFPLSNLLVNFPFARRLFPYNHMNRASHYSYYPQSFDHAVHHVLTSREQTSPLFIAIHFTLAHWPYAYASSSPAQVKDEYSMTEREQLFSSAIHQADQQVSHLLDVLQQNGYLENSLVVLLSDHGETLYAPGSRQTKASAYQGQGQSKLANYFKRKTSTVLEMSAGHGSDLLSTDQYHCVLACKIYDHGALKTPSRSNNTRVALIDLAPTILDFSGIQDRPDVDGISLLSNLLNQRIQLPKRAFIMESGMLPNQFLSRDQARQLGQQYFDVDQQSGLLHIRKQQLAKLDAMKLYAMIKDDWVFALYPDDHGYLPITQRLSDGAWMDELSGDFVKSSPAAGMLEDIRRFYEKPFTVSQTD